MLKGKVIAITRAAGSQDETASMIAALGGIPYHFPTVGFKRAEGTKRVAWLVGALRRREIDYVVFMSWNGFLYLAEMCDAVGGGDIRRILRWQRIVAVGPQTAQKLRGEGLRVSAVAEEYSSDGVVGVLGKMGAAGKRVVIIRNRSAEGSMAGRIRRLGAKATEVCTYQTFMPYDSAAAVRFADGISAGRIDAIIFGSPLSAVNMLKMLGKQGGAGKAAAMVRSTTVAAIGRTTAQKLEELGIRADVVPKEYTFKNLVDELDRCL